MPGSAAGPVQIQPSELMKLALILFAAQLVATRPEIVKGGVGAMAPVLTVVGAGVFVVGVGDLGTALVTCLAITALLVGAGARLRDIGLLAAGAAAVVLLAVLIEPYRVARITSFLDPGGDPGGAGFQLIQAKIALGSGGLFGVGLGESLQKAFYLPEAHTDMIAAVIGEELGLVGIGGAGRPLRAVRLRRASGSPSAPATATASCSPPGSPRWSWSRRWSTCSPCSASRRSPGSRCRSSPTATRACW